MVGDTGDKDEQDKCKHMHGRSTVLSTSLSTSPVYLAHFSHKPFRVCLSCPFSDGCLHKATGLCAAVSCFEEGNLLIPSPMHGFTYEEHVSLSTDSPKEFHSRMLRFTLLSPSSPLVSPSSSASSKRPGTGEEGEEGRTAGLELTF